MITKSDTKNIPGLMSMSDIRRAGEKIAAERNANLKHDKARGVLQLRHKNPKMPYEVNLDRISTFKGMVQVLHHLMDKTWLSKLHIQEIMEEICDIKGWEIH